MRGPDSLAYRALCYAWFTACIARLTLLEAAHGWWWAATILLLVGALGLIRFGGRVWWTLSLIGLAWPYFLLRDWMTQSLVMMLIAVGGVATVSSFDGGHRVRTTAHWIVASTYFAAAFHKLNSGFFDAELSCATYGWSKLSAFFDSGLAPPFEGGGMGYAVVATELLIGVLLLMRPRSGILVGLVFHIPLTMVLAPAFVFVMGVGYAAALGPAEWEAVRTMWRTSRRLIGWPVLALLFPLLGDADAILTLKLAVVLSAFGTVLRLETRREQRAARHQSWRGPAVLVALFALNAATPYFGTQYQHTGAMLSNLRIDDGCWNHLLVPAPAIGEDPYLRIDFASMGPPAAPVQPRPFADREDVLTSTLWQVSSLNLIRENWCREHTAPITLIGTFRGAPIHIEDLCSSQSELRGVGIFGGTEWVPTFLKLQKNLVRECPTQCIH